MPYEYDDAATDAPASLKWGRFDHFELVFTWFLVVVIGILATVWTLLVSSVPNAVPVTAVTLALWLLSSPCVLVGEYARMTAVGHRRLVWVARALAVVTVPALLFVLLSCFAQKTTSSVGNPLILQLVLLLIVFTRVHRIGWGRNVHGAGEQTRQRERSRASRVASMAFMMVIDALCLVFLVQYALSHPVVL